MCSHLPKHRVHQANQASAAPSPTPLAVGGPGGLLSGGARPACSLLLGHLPVGSADEEACSSCSGHSGNRSVLSARITPCKS